MHAVLDDNLDIVAVRCLNEWSRDKKGNPVIKWVVCLPNGIYYADLPLFTEWWEDEDEVVTYDDCLDIHEACLSARAAQLEEYDNES